MGNILRSLILNPVLSTLILGFLILSGLLGVLSIKREAYPRVNFNTIRITTIYPGASPEDIEQKVTIPIEEKIREVEGLDSVRSISRNSESEITVKVDLEAKDPIRVMDEVRRSVDQVQNLPKAIIDKPLIYESKSSSFPILEISLFGEMSEGELQNLARDLREEILTSKFVAKVDLFGKRKKEWQVLLDTKKIGEQKIGPFEVAEAIGNQNISFPGGSFSSSLTKNIRTTGEFLNINELEDLALRTNDIGNKLVLKNIAEFKDSFEKPRFAAMTRGYDAINFSIIKKDSEDIIATVKDVEKKIQSFSKRMPSYAKIQEINNEGTRAEKRLEVVMNNSLQGFILVIIVLFVFLSFKESILTSISLPLALVGTFAILPLFDVSFNLISMLGIVISLGMLVDNSIVISENIYNYRRKGLGAVESSVKGVQELILPLIGSYLTTVAAFLPMAFMTGIMGKFVWQIPFTVIVTLTVSLFESFFLLPVRIAKYGKDKSSENAIRVKIENWINSLQVRFAKFIETVVYSPIKTILIIIGIFVGSIFALGFTQFNLFPKEGIDFVLVRVEFPTEYTVAQTREKMKYVEDIFKKIPSNELISYTVKIGIQQVDPTDPLTRIGEHLAMAQILFIPENERKRTAREIMDDFKPDLLNTPGALKVQIDEVVNGPPVGAAVTLAVQGKDYKVLEKIASRLKTELSKINGIQNINDDYNDGREEVVLSLNSDTGPRSGVSSNNLGFTVRSYFEGYESSQFRQGKDEIKIKVMTKPEYRDSIEDLKDLKVANRYGLLTPIPSIAMIQYKTGKEALLHYDFQRAITVTATVDELVTSSHIVNQQIEEQFSKISEEFPGYRIQFKGEEEDTNKSMASLARAGILAFFGIFAILAILFRSYKLPGLILLSIPLGFVGVVFGFIVSNRAFSFLAMIGIIGLAGVIVNTSIVLVDSIEEKRKSGIGLAEALILASRDRLRPILLTTITTMAGLIPTAYSLGGSDPILIPMTLALAWGLGFGTLGSLIFIPAVYSLLRLPTNSKKAL